MNKNILVEIFASDGSDEGNISTGYPVADGRILTARHGLLDDNGEPLSNIEVRWHHQERDENGGWKTADVVWPKPGDSAEDLAFDVAILSCEFPECAPGWGYLSGAKPRDDGQWISEGFPAVGEKNGSREAIPLKGAPFSMADRAAVFHVSNDASVKLPDDWRGASGCPVFVDDKIIGVVVTCPEGFDAQRMAATPVWKLLGSSGFQTAIGYQRRKARCDAIKQDLCSLIDGCPKPAKLREALVDAASEQLDGCEDSTGELVERMLNLPVDEMLEISNEAVFILRDSDLLKEAGCIRSVVSLLLPVVFDHGLIESARSQTGVNPIVSLPVATHTVVEIIMAGLEGRAVSFLKPASSRELATGAYRVCDPPNAGIHDGSETFERDFIAQLANRFFDEQDFLGSDELSHTSRIQLVRRKLGRRGKINRRRPREVYYYIYASSGRNEVDDSARQLLSRLQGKLEHLVMVDLAAANKQPQWLDEIDTYGQLSELLLQTEEDKR